MSRRVLLLFLGLVLAAPFGEGGRAPLALLILHTLVLLLGVIAADRVARDGVRSVGPGAPLLRGAIAAGLVLSGVSAWRADYPYAAGLGFLDLLIAAVVFIAALESGASEGDLLVLRTAVIAATGFQAIAALALYSSGGPPASARFFLNSDHLAAFVNFGFLLAGTAALDAAAEGRRRAATSWAGIAMLHLATTLLLASRGGLLGLAAGLGFLLATRAGSFPPAGRRAAFVGVVVIVLTGGVVAWQRFARVPDPYRYSRLTIWRAAIGMVADRPFLGFGPGMLPYEGPRHNVANVVGPFRFEKTFTGAHSAALSLAVENGIPAAACLIMAVVAGVVVLIRSGGDRRAERIGRGIAVAIVPLLTQGLVEDLHQRPALVLIPAALAGCALAATWRRGGGGLPAPERASVRTETGPSNLIARVAALYLFAAAVALPYLADREARVALAEGRAGLGHMETAARLNPLQPEYRHDLAMAALNAGPLTPESYARAVTLLLEARRLKRSDPRFPLLLGRLEALAGRRLFDDRSAERRALGYYEEAIRLAPVDPRPRLELAGHLADLGRGDEALPLLAEALALEPRFVRARILQASVLLRLGRTGPARASYEAAVGTLSDLRNVPLDSGYARDLALDAPEERERLAAALGVRRPGGDGG
jgi:tetratricopeptide (TPR) repeat protein/O-antigen ligase